MLLEPANGLCLPTDLQRKPFAGEGAAVADHGQSAVVPKSNAVAFGSVVGTRSNNKSTDPGRPKVVGHCRANDAARLGVVPEDRDPRGVAVGAGAVRGEVAEPDQVHGALQQDELLGAKSDIEAGGWKGAREVRDQVHKDYEAPAEDQQLQFLSGSVVSIGFSTNPTVSRRFCFYS